MTRARRRKAARRQKAIDKAVSYRERHGMETHDPRPRTLVRADDFFTSHSYTKNGRKNLSSYVHFDDDGVPTLSPADHTGGTGVLSHVVGDVGSKNKSPYTSFSAQQYATISDKPRPKQEKSYGRFEMEVNLDALERDHPDSVVRTRDVKREIMDDTRQKTGVSPPTKKFGDEDIPGIARSSGLTGKKHDQLERRLYALSHTQRDREYLLKGNIPSKYIRRIGLAKPQWQDLKGELQDAVAKRKARQEAGKSLGPVGNQQVQRAGSHLVQDKAE